jgi:hypothetical protein
VMFTVPLAPAVTYWLVVVIGERLGDLASP